MKNLDHERNARAERPDSVNDGLDYCRHPFERLLRIRGSLMCGVCCREVDRYWSPLDEALKWWQQQDGDR
jgi:hypothetical protein